MITGAFLIAAAFSGSLSPNVDPAPKASQSVKSTITQSDHDILFELAVLNVCPEAVKTAGSSLEHKSVLEKQGFVLNTIVSRIVSTPNNKSLIATSKGPDVSLDSSPMGWNGQRCSVLGEDVLIAESMRKLWKRLVPNVDLDATLKKKKHITIESISYGPDFKFSLGFFYRGPEKNMVEKFLVYVIPST